MVEDEPLKPVYNPQRPPWAGYFTGRDYNGRKNWWAELGYTDRYTPQGKHCTHMYSIRERDPEWFDPPVEDGTSVAGFRGLDTKYHRNEEMKMDQVGNLFDYKNYLMKSSTQYKNIVDKYKLSPEHPGLDVSPTLSRLEYTPWRNLGAGSFFSTGGSQWGPRFFDKPMNEGCFEKGLALVKYSACFTLINTAADYKSKMPNGEPKHFRYGEFAKLYAKNFIFPATLAFGYGVSICTSATIRNKDDIYNPLYAAAFTGILTATLKDNIPLGFTLSLMLAFGGTIMHYARVSRNGMSGPQYNPGFASPFWGGPLIYKSLDFGRAEVPTDLH